MKDPAFLTSPIYPPKIFPTHFLSTQRDDHLKSLLSHDNHTVKSQLTSSYKLPIDNTLKLNDKDQYFFTSIASKN